MPRGGRRPGAGAPKGNLNGLKHGAYSNRMRLALAAMLSVPEYRLIFRFLHSAGAHAHRDFTDLLVATTRVIYDVPVTDEVRRLIDQAFTNYLNRVGPVDARRAIHEFARRNTAELLPLAKKRRLSRKRLSAENPVFQEFARLLVGIDLGAANQTPKAAPTTD